MTILSNLPFKQNYENHIKKPNSNTFLAFSSKSKVEQVH